MTCRQAGGLVRVKVHLVICPEARGRNVRAQGNAFVLAHISEGGNPHRDKLGIDVGSPLIRLLSRT
jgi:hypothetical protein